MIRSRVILVVAAILQTLALQSSAQIATLTDDLRTTADPERGARFEELKPFGSRLVFSAGADPVSIEPWISDGTPLGTRVLLESCPGGCGQNVNVVASGLGLYFYFAAFPEAPSDLALWATDGSRNGEQVLTPPGVKSSQALSTIGGNLAFFSASDASHGIEPWVSDGTAAGTRLLADLRPGPESSFAGLHFDLGSRAVFLANVGSAGNSLFSTDGTSAGTREILPLAGRTFRYGASGVVDGRLFFFLTGGSGLPALWVTDGTTAGTRKVREWNDLGFFLYEKARVVGNELVVPIYTNALFTELWATNGTAAGTRRITNLTSALPFDDTPGAVRLEKLGTRYVSLTRETNGQSALWTSDGNPASTRELVKASCPECSVELVSGSLSRVGERIYFVVRHPTFGVELWTSDGTEGGTRLYAEVCPGACGDVQRIAAVGAEIYWVAFDFDSGYELWRGNAAGVRQLTRFPAPEPFPFEVVFEPWIAPLGDGVAFAADDGDHGGQLWWQAGNAAPTRITAIDAGTADSDPRTFLDLGGKAVFHACTGDSERELWSSQGNSTNTLILRAETFGECDFFFGAAFGRAGEKAFFVPAGNDPGATLWASDGTPQGTRQVAELPSSPRNVGLPFFAELNGLVYFPQIFDDRFELWRSDGTSEGTSVAVAVHGPRISGLSGLETVAGDLYFITFPFVTGPELWRSDGTNAGTTRLLTDQSLSGELEPTALDGNVYFRASSAEGGVELWRTDGTPQGTGQVIDLFPGFESSEPSGLTAFDGALFFFARSDVDAWGLWKTDGTAVGTELIRSFNSTALDEFLRIETPVVFGDSLFLALGEDEHGHELWKTDGTAEGTVLVADLFPGSGSSSVGGLTVADGRLFFAATDPSHGRELWSTLGTSGSTALVHDLMPGPLSSSPRELAMVGSRLYFSADDGISGREPWSLDLLSDPTTCPSSDSGLCLQNNRFRVEIDWRDFQGNTGRGTPVPLTADTGYFWFFNPANVESIVKVLDGRPLNNHFWTFYGALSNVEYTMTVTDAQTGLTQRYFNPSRQFASVGDTESFGPNGASLESFTAPSQSLFQSHEPIIDSLFDLSKAGSCIPSSTRLCLNNGRFAVEASWTDFQGNSGIGMAEDLTSDTGYFWFFRDTNVEVVLKVLDGRPLNGKFWVFYGALSNVEYTLTVTDTETGAVKTYFNPSRRFASVGDTGAF